MIVAVNYLAVVVAALASMIVGFVWYGPLFGKKWMRLRGMDPASMQGMKFPKKEMAIQFIASLVTAWVLAEFVTWLGIATLHFALLLGVWIWLGFYVTTLLDGSLWYKQPWGIYWINLSQRFVSILLMAAIIGVWR